MPTSRWLTEPPVPCAALDPGHQPRDLETELGRRWAHRVTVLHGGPGRGKSVAVARALDAHHHDRAGLDVWFSCEPADAGGQRLARAILATLAEHRADRPRRTRGTVVPRTPTVTAVRDAVWALAPLQVCLVLDDVHHLPTHSDGMRLVRDLVRSLPDNGHLLLVTRRLAALPFSVRGVDDDALVIDPALLPGLPDDPRLDALTEEQVVALELGRAVGPLDDRTARALLGTATRLDQLFDGVPYVLRSGATFLVHEQWDEWLAAARSSGPRATEQQRQWQAAAVTFARQSGDLDRAFFLAAGAGDWDQAVEVVADACRAMLFRARQHRVDQWLPLLPESAHRSSAVRLATTLVDRGLQEGELHGRLAPLVESLASSGEADLELVALVRVSLLAWRAGDTARFAGVVDRMAELAAAGNVDAGRTHALGQLMLAEASGDVAGMWQLLGAIVDEPSDGQMRSMVTRYRALIELQYGSPLRALELTERSATDVVPALRHEMLTIRAWGLWFDGRTTQALAMVEHALTDPTDPASDTALAANHELMSALTGHRPPTPRSTVDALESRCHRARSQGLVVASVVLALAAAVRLATDGRENDARDLLHRCLPPASEASIREVAGTLRSPAVPRILLGGLPPVPAADDLGDGPRAALAAAEALVALREGRPDATSRAADLLTHSHLTPTSLPPVWAVELALRLEIARESAGQDTTAATEAVDRLIDQAGPAGEHALVTLAQSPAPRLREAARRARLRLVQHPSGGLVLRMLGPVTIERGGVPLEHPDWRRERVRALLVMLLRRESVSRAEVCERLWPDLDATPAQNNLRVTLSYLQRVLSATGTPDGDGQVLRVNSGAIRLVRPAAWTTDAAELDTHLDEADRADRAGDLPRAIVSMRLALEWYRGPYLADMRLAAADELERERLHSRVVAATVRLGALLAADGDLAEAQRLAVRALTIDPWSEPAAALEISSYLAAGNRTAAVRAYRRCRTALAELDLEPSDVVEHVVNRLRTQR